MKLYIATLVLAVLGTLGMVVPLLTADDWQRVEMPKGKKLRPGIGGLQKTA